MGCAVAHAVLVDAPCHAKMSGAVLQVTEGNDNQTTSGSNPTTAAVVTFGQLLNMSYTQINSSQVLLQIAIDAGYSSIDEMIPGLEMLWDDVSAVKIN
jgi:hypothetical protein